MKFIRSVSIVLVTVGIATLSWKSNGQTADEEIQAGRRMLETDRKATVANAMQFTAEEGEAFWPLYKKYRAKMDEQGDALLKLIWEYAELYPDVPDDRAKVMLKELANLEKQRVATRNSAFKKIAKTVSPAKTLRFAQIESRLDLGLQLELAAVIPLVPIEGRLTGEAGEVSVVAEGIPGGASVATYELTATVAAIDKKTRRVTLVNDAGIKTTVKAGPEVTNFNQIRVGDQLEITAAQELVVHLADENEKPADAGAELVALAPEGAKPGTIVVETTQLVAKVTAIDVENHEATLRFEGGSTRIVAVRPDVDLRERKVGDRVVVRITEAVAIQISTP